MKEINMDGIAYVPKDSVSHSVDKSIKTHSTYIETTPENFYQIRWLDKYMVKHKGFIAGGCFKNILSGERVKDIDIFFENEGEFHEAVDLFNSDDLVKEGWKFKYRNEKVCAFQKDGEKTWVEFIQSEFGTPEEILRSFDFTVAKMAYFKKNVESEDGSKIEYTILHHPNFFEHLHMKRLVIDENIPFPISTWERTYRYAKYGYKMCRETKKKLLDAIRNTTPSDNDLSMYNVGGWD